MTITNRSADHMTVERQLVSYTVTREDATTASAGYVLETEEALERLRSYPWASDIKVRVERSTFAVGDTVEVQAFGRVRVAKVTGFGRTKLQLAVIKNAQGEVHQGSYAAERVTNLTRPAVVLSEVADDAPACSDLEAGAQHAPHQLGREGAQATYCDGVAEPAPTATVRRIAAPSGNRDSDRFQATCPCGWTAAAAHSNRTTEGRTLAERDAADHRCTPRALDREVKLTGRDSADQVDLYVDGQLVLPALTREERNDLWQQLARLDAAQDHGYGVRTLTELELPAGLALVHNANVHHLALWEEGASTSMQDWQLDPRLTTEQVHARAAELAAEVSRRVRDGEL